MHNISNVHIPQNHTLSTAKARRICTDEPARAGILSRTALKQIVAEILG